MLTVPEAARELRFGRTLAYQLVAAFEAGDPCGLPVLRLGNCLRVPRWALDELIRYGQSGDRHERRRGCNRRNSARQFGVDGDRSIARTKWPSGEHLAIDCTTVAARRSLTHIPR